MLRYTQVCELQSSTFMGQTDTYWKKNHVWRQWSYCKDISLFWSTFRTLAANELSFCNWFFWVKASALKRLYIWCIINVSKRGAIRRFWLRNANKTQLGKRFLQLMTLGRQYILYEWMKRELVFYAQHKAKTTCSPNVTSSVATYVVVACGTGWSQSRVSS